MIIFSYVCVIFLVICHQLGGHQFKVHSFGNLQTWLITFTSFFLSYVRPPENRPMSAAVLQINCLHSNFECANCRQASYKSVFFMHY
jgi:hypothetical protein